ncbi:hypothetical protein SNOG_02740 [Parastagonospora nodorum SN15]|uniref:Uncharacterized protein n=1 Tax=Phaeosphaeria nodorum (strain SN15 / ATCC MYA-4574 / FGSC 10173) TaxID=321614 RepID=Q0UZS4_PHANO|nr:hypothetical protein SNOG_02740 [Parastagonospora nodorum SN15]EAT89471.1 hypothetical protein SNOG_02740 [Parastagonospora nodorum SN15]
MSTTCAIKEQDIEQAACNKITESSSSCIQRELNSSGRHFAMPRRHCPIDDGSSRKLG